MPNLRILSPGFQTTVQDLGRPGFAHQGISASGAADPISLRLGNLLVGNPENAAALEMTLVGGVFQFDSPAVIAIAGADFEAECNGVRAPMHTGLYMKVGDVLAFRGTRTGARCYLCIAGGFQVPPLLGSRSTHLTTGLGGHGGRALKKGDVIEFGFIPDSAIPLRRIPEQVLQCLHRTTLRVTSGPQAEWFGENPLETLTHNPYNVTESCSRMGIRLQGIPLRSLLQREMITQGASLGAIQIPPEGLPIILFVEHQTTGGYPIIANVITADLHAVGQLRPRDRVRFELVSFQQAVELASQLYLLLNSQILEPAHD